MRNSRFNIQQKVSGTSMLQGHCSWWWFPIGSVFLGANSTINPGELHTFTCDQGYLWEKQPERIFYFLHRVKTKDIQINYHKGTHDNMFSAKVGKKRTPSCTSWKNWNKILKNQEVRMVSVEVGYRAMSSSQPSFCCLSTVQPLSFWKPKFTFDAQRLLSQGKLASPLSESGHCVASPRAVCPLCFSSNPI